MCSRKELIIYLGLVFSLLSAIINGLDMSFNTYALTTKRTFNFTQTQVEIVASMSNLGLGLCFLETLSIYTLGYKVTFSLTWMAMVLFSGLFSLAAVYSSFVHSMPGLIYVIQLVVAMSNGAASVTMARINVQTFPVRHAGKIIAAFYSMYCLGHAFFGLLIDYFFRENLAGFFLSIAVSTAILFGITYCLLYPNVRDQDVDRQTAAGISEGGVKLEYEPIRSMDDDDNNNNNKFGGKPEAEQTFKGDVLKSKFFHGTFWSTLLLYACASSCMNNITAIANSIGIPHPMSTVYINAVVTILSRLIFGLIFDKFSSVACGLFLLLVSFVGFTFGLGISIFWLNTQTMYAVSSLYALGSGPGFTILSSTLVLKFGRQHFAAISVTFYAMLSCVVICIQLMMGMLYDDISTDVFCRGPFCFYWSFVIMLTISSAGIAIQSIIFYHHILSIKDQCHTKRRSRALDGVTSRESAVVNLWPCRKCLADC